MAKIKDKKCKFYSDYELLSMTDEELHKILDIYKQERSFPTVTVHMSVNLEKRINDIRLLLEIDFEERAKKKKALVKWMKGNGKLRRASTSEKAQYKVVNPRPYQGGGFSPK